MKTKFIIFDLDDTLTYEIDYLKSAYQEIALYLDPNKSSDLYTEMIKSYNEGLDVFGLLITMYPSSSKEELISLYRNHFPKINLIEGAIEVLQYLKSNDFKLGLISDGRSITQRNKIKALDIEHFFDRIIISEEFGSLKPDFRNFEIFNDSSINDFFYIADNTKKDFITPNKLGWITICLLNKGWNIHEQDFSLDKDYLPRYKITNFIELKSLL